MLSRLRVRLRSPPRIPLRHEANRILTVAGPSLTVVIFLLLGPAEQALWSPETGCWPSTRCVWKTAQWKTRCMSWNKQKIWSNSESRKMRTTLVHEPFKIHCTVGDLNQIIPLVVWFDRGPGLMSDICQLVAL